MKNIDRRKFLQTSTSLVVAGAMPGLLLGSSGALAADGSTVKLGLLHSLTGTIALAEAALVDAEKPGGFTGCACWCCCFRGCFLH